MSEELIFVTSDMVVEVYLDVIIFVNLIVNYLLLNVVQKLLNCPPKRVRCLAGAVLGVLGVCLMVYLPIHKNFVNLLPVHMVTSTLMVKVGCKIKHVRMLIKGVIILYVTAFIGGGMFYALYQGPAYLHLRTFLFFGILFYELFLCIHFIMKKWKREQSHYMDVTLYANEKSKKVRGLYDTGNRLTDQLSGKPVTVAEAGVLRELYETDIEYIESLQPHYIAYCAVGTPNGVLLAVTIDKMMVEKEHQTFIISRPVLALSEENISFTQHYQLILNPDLIDY